MKSKRNQLLLLIFSVLFGVLCCSSIQAEAKTYTSKSAVKKDIKKLTKQRKAVKKKLTAAQKKEKKERTGNTKALYGTAISSNPLIIEQPKLFGNTEYYWVKSGAKYLSHYFVTYSGTVKLTNKTKTYYIDGYRYTCNVCKGIKVSNKSLTYQKKLTSIDNKLAKLKNTLKNKIIFDFKEDTVYKGETVNNIGYRFKYNSSYNKVTFKSSNTNVLTISSKGKVVPKNFGTATITATCSITKTKTTMKVRVVSNFSISYSIDDGDWHQFDDDDPEPAVFTVEGASIQFKVKVHYENGQKISYKIVDGSGVTVDQNGLLKCNKASGGATLRISTGETYKDIVISVEAYIDDDDDI